MKYIKLPDGMVYDTVEKIVINPIELQKEKEQLLAQKQETEEMLLNELENRKADFERSIMSIEDRLTDINK